MAEQLELSNLSREQLEEIIRRSQRQQSLSGQKDVVKVAASVVQKTSEKLEAEISQASQRAAVVKSVDACFVLDCTGSMKSTIQGAKEKIVEIQRRIVGSLGHGGNVRFSVVGYRDHNYRTPFEILLLSKDVKKVEGFLSKLRTDVPTTLASDLCEDVIGGLSHAMQLDWEARTRIIYLVCDAPPHGSRFKDSNVSRTDYDTSPDSADQWETTDRIMAKSVALNLNFVLLEYANGLNGNLVLGKTFQVFSNLRRTSSPTTLQTLHLRPNNSSDDFVQCILSSTKETLSKTLTRPMSNKSGARSSGSSGSTLSLDVKSDVCWKDCKNWPFHQSACDKCQCHSSDCRREPQPHDPQAPYSKGTLREWQHEFRDSKNCISSLKFHADLQIVVGERPLALLGNPSKLPWHVLPPL